MNENFHDNISCLDEDSLFDVRAICGASYRNEHQKPRFALMKSSAALQDVTVHAKLGEMVDVIICMH